MRWVVCWICLLVLTANAFAGNKNTGKIRMRVDARPAWQGVVRAGAWTEIAVRVVSDSGGEVTIDIAGDKSKTIFSGRLDPGVSRLFRVPVRPGAANPLDVAVRGPGGGLQRLEVPLRRLSPTERALAYSAHVLDRGQLGKPWAEGVLIAIDPLDLPVTARAFECIDALILDARVLASLEEAQLQALEGDLGTCGRVLIVGVSEAAVAREKDRAGCAGEFFAAIAAGEEIEEPLQRLLEKRPPFLPKARKLVSMFARHDNRAAAKPLVGFVAFYASALILGGAAIRRSWMLIVMPVAASIVLLLAFSASRPEVSVISWTEIWSGATAARFAAVVRIDGIGPRRVDIEIPRILGPVDLPYSEAHLSLRSGAAAVTGARFAVYTQLLSEDLLYLRGAFDWTPSVSVDIHALGPWVENHGVARSSPGYLIWREDVFAIPALDPQEDWTASGTTPLARNLIPAWVAEQRQRPEDAAVLLPGVPEVLRRVDTTVPPAGWTAILTKGSM